MKQKTLSSIEELLNFYNRYLGIENDEQDIKHIIVVLANSFISKISEKTTIGEVKTGELRFKSEDFARLTRFEVNCLKFYRTSSIKIDDNLTISIDAFGKITGFISASSKDLNLGLTNSTILDYFEKYGVSREAKRDLKNVIVQNILVSKIYKAILEDLQNKDYLTANLFYVTNAGVLNYEETLNNNFDVKKCLAASFGRTRSPK